jgi:hypothetical protein
MYFKHEKDELPLLSGSIPWNHDKFVSPYGDPELAMLFQEGLDTDEEFRAQVELENISYIDYYGDLSNGMLIGWESLAPVERYILDKIYEGMGQQELADSIGVSQPSICYKSRALKEFLAFAARGHHLLSQCKNPYAWFDWNNSMQKKDERLQVWSKVVFEHKNVSLASIELGLKQEQAQRFWSEMLYHFLLVNHDKVEELAYFIAGSKWTRKKSKLTSTSKGRGLGIDNLDAEPTFNAERYLLPIDDNRDLCFIPYPTRKDRGMLYWEPAKGVDHLIKTIKAEMEIVSKFGHNEYVIVDGRPIDLRKSQVAGRFKLQSASSPL